MADHSTPKPLAQADNRQQFASSNDCEDSMAGQSANDRVQQADGKHHPAHLTPEESSADHIAAQPARPEDASQQSLQRMSFKPFQSEMRGKFELDDPFVRVTASINSDGQCFKVQDQNYTAEDFEKREFRHVLAMVSDYVTNDCQHHVKVSRSQRLVRLRGNDEHGPKLFRLDERHIHVAIITWQGLSFPEPLYGVEFEELADPDDPTQPTYTPDRNPKKFWLSDRHESGLSWRWSVFAIFEGERGNPERTSAWLKQVRGLFEPKEQQYLVTGHVKVKFRADELTLKRLMQETQQGAPTSIEEFHKKQEASAAMHALLKLNYNGRSSLAVHGNKFFDADDDNSKTVKGVLRCAGTTRVLRTGTSYEVEVSEKPTFKYFFPSTTVADFLTKGYPSLFRHEDMGIDTPEICEDVLRNIRVYVPCAADSKDTEIRRIRSISSRTCNTLPPTDRGLGWPSKKKALNDRLPLINVGSERRPRLLPVEFCNFLPMQTFNRKKRPLPPGFGAALAELESEVSTTAAEASADNSDKISQVLSDREEQITRPSGASVETTRQPATMDEPVAEPPAKAQEHAAEGDTDEPSSKSQQDEPGSKAPHYLFVVPPLTALTTGCGSSCVAA